MLTEIWAYRDQAVPGLDIAGFRVEGRDGLIGRVDRATSEVDANYIVVDADAKRFILPAGLVNTVDLPDRRVLVDATTADVRSAPAFEERSGFTPAYRSQLGRYYGELRGESPSGARITTASRPQPTQTGTAGRRSGRAPSRTRATRSTGRSRKPAEPTKEELYKKAKRLGIEGRSKMNKAQLAKAVERADSRSSKAAGGKATRRRAKANPIEVQKFLDGVGYPAGKRELVNEAKKQRASSEVRSTLEQLPDRRFADPTEVSEAIGTLS
jgi:hypothetical protein